MIIALKIIGVLFISLIIAYIVFAAILADENARERERGEDKEVW